MRVQIINNSGFELPEYKTNGSVGMDLKAKLENDKLFLYPKKIYIIPTGIHIKLPEPFIETLTGEGWSYEAQIRPRSGLSAKYGITVVNSPGTIDNDYTGEIKVILMNLSDNEDVFIEHGDRIAQMVINRVEIIKWEQVDELKQTKRGDGGFGHTGKK
jgi:dUTP pyrophosphatase